MFGKLVKVRDALDLAFAVESVSGKVTNNSFAQELRREQAILD